jgi:geranylgeranyl diphosphate synthase type II
MNQQELLEAFEKALVKETFAGRPAELYDPIAYTMGQKGKRMRPLLLMMSCELFGGNFQDAVYPAIAVEVFHNFTLVHDDIMDKATLRRGKETVYQKWNESIAILSGDTMFAMANKYMARGGNSNLSEMLNIFNQTAIEVCEGQQLDMNFEKQDDVSIEEYLRMIQLKTAVLLGCSTKIGAIIAGASQHDAELIWNYAIDLGIAFQLKDDLLDAFGDEKVFGKRTGGDIASNKKTYLFLKALMEADQSEKAELISLYSDPGVETGHKISRVLEIFIKLNIEYHTGQMINQYYDKANNALDEISVPEERKTDLKTFADYLMNRIR